MSRLFALVFLSGCAAPLLGPEPVICPTIAIEPHAGIALSSGLGEGTYDVTVVTDGISETCTLTVGPTHGAVELGGMVAAPTTQTGGTCAAVSIRGMNDDGTAGLLEVHGTPKAITLTIAKGGVQLGTVSASPDYTPDACGFVQPSVPMTVAVGR